jgi:tetratricopeptide (TPR) repeat protein
MSPSVAQASSTSYAAAAELNNIGVELISAKEYELAMQTLEEGIQMLDSFTQNQNHISRPIQTRDPLAWCLETRTVVERARQRSIADRTRAYPFNPRLVETFFIPLLIDSRPGSLAGQQDPDMAAAILHYNYGVAHRRLAFEEYESSHNLNEAALGLFLVAYWILIESNKVLARNNRNDLSETRLMLLLMILNSLFHVHDELGNHAEAAESLQLLLHLGGLVLEQEINPNYPFISFAPAA